MPGTLLRVACRGPVLTVLGRCLSCICFEALGEVTGVAEAAGIGDLFCSHIGCAEQVAGVLDACRLHEVLGGEVEQLVHLPIERRAAHIRHLGYLVDGEVVVAYMLLHELMQGVQEPFVHAGVAGHQYLGHGQRLSRLLIVGCLLVADAQVPLLQFEIRLQRLSPLFAVHTHAHGLHGDSHRDEQQQSYLQYPACCALPERRGDSDMQSAGVVLPLP